MISERYAAFGDDHAMIAGVSDLGNRMPHVLGREELSLLDVDDASGRGGGDEQIRLTDRNAGI